MVRVVVAVLSLSLGTPLAAGGAIVNGTGLPAYPNLEQAAMDPLLHTETFGRWCAKFTGRTSDTLSTVESWYRKALRRASETNLSQDRQYNTLPDLAGIKLAVGVDYVTVFRVANAPTVIELHRCGWNH